MSQLERQFTIVHLGADHAGRLLKDELMVWLKAEGFAVVDHGAYRNNPEDDFPDFITPVAEIVARSGHGVAGLVFGGSGQGEAVAANRLVGVRAAVYYGAKPEIVTLARQHNNANILSIGARFVASDEAKAVIWEWLHTPALAAKKYDRRNQKIDDHQKHNVA